MYTEFRPARSEVITISGKAESTDPGRRHFTFLTWNLGYAGLNSASDFFYDGGKMVRPEEAVVKQNLSSIVEQVKQFDSIDFLLFQEVDIHSKRSWYQDQYKQLTSVFPGYAGMFSTNYSCRYIPVPLGEPMGDVHAGLAAFSRFEPVSAVAHYFDVNFPWPKSMVFLKRCFMLMKYPLGDGKELVLINIHNSAYDSTGDLRKRELFMLDSVMREEYCKGNYVVAGGDWNTNPPGFQPTGIRSGDIGTLVDNLGVNGFFKGWTFAFDPLKPSNRYLNMPYEKGKTLTTTIDFFILSPNLNLDYIQALPMAFSWSDHEPVVMRVSLADHLVFRTGEKGL
jgi:endonuclease/exonuclease/phosphatase family metal-dependent hydrolase